MKAPCAGDLTCPVNMISSFGPAAAPTHSRLEIATSNATNPEETDAHAHTHTHKHTHKCKITIFVLLFTRITVVTCCALKKVLHFRGWPQNRLRIANQNSHAITVAMACCWRIFSSLGTVKESLFRWLEIAARLVKSGSAHPLC